MPHSITLFKFQYVNRKFAPPLFSRLSNKKSGNIAAFKTKLISDFRIRLLRNPYP